MEYADKQSMPDQVPRSPAPRNDGAHDAKKMALSFARAVTVESDDASHWVAQNGDRSLFKALQDLMPEVLAPA